jgi:iron complex outermembrane recepter protein
MKFKTLTTILFTTVALALAAQEKADTINLPEFNVTANRLPGILKKNPGAVSVVTPKILSVMPKTIAADEALRLVPGVRIDNQHTGERVHISIRGQGILTERGLRGIGVMLDGIPVNDPSGFAPDLYDADWATIKEIQVLRGPVAGIYGASGAAGMINITTMNGGEKPFGGEASLTMGSNGFFKGLLQVDGSQKNIDYRLSYSRTSGDGYRDHQAFWGNNLYEKINFRPSKKITITQIYAHTDYFHQNPEGLNLGQFDNLKQANPDARPFNEYQKTNRTTFGLVGNFIINEKHDIQVTSYLRNWDYKETSNKAAEYRNYTVPGASAQYNLHLGKEKIRNHFSLGADLKWQNISMYKLQSGSDPDRKESIDETNIETDSLLANQLISQNSIGAFLLYKLEFNKLSLMANIRYDDMNNELTDKMMVGDTAVTSEDFSSTSFRIGLNYAFRNEINVFANWSQGFMPPSTEELASNPLGYSGFNTHLVPATSNCYEAGLRGFFGEKVAYDVTGFLMYTENDFFRFKQSGRGNQEVFYGNAGNSRRFGIETYISYRPVKQVELQAAYTYSDFEYTSSTVDPVYTDTAYVLTTPPEPGQWLPNSPRHQLYAEAEYKINKNFRLTLSTEYQSEWAIYTDAKAYAGELDPAIYQNWQDGFNLWHFRAGYLFNIWKLNGELSFYVKNIFNTEYMAFTEPDPDGNSYQPGPGREFFGTLKVKF